MNDCCVRWAPLAAAIALVGCARPADPPVVEAGPPVTVNFRFPRQQIVLDDAFIGGRGPFNLILDTAVDPSVIDLTLARELGLAVEMGSPRRAAGVGTDDVPAFPARIEGLTIGTLEVGSVAAVAMDLRPFRERLGRPLHGALGHSFLRSRAVRIDYPGRAVSIYGGAVAAPVGAGGHEVPMVLTPTGVYLEPVFLNGRSLGVNLDTGASLGLTVYGHAVARLGLGGLRDRAAEGLVRGARGRAAVLTATADSLRVGGLSIQRPEIAFPSWERSVDGTLGNGFLRHFVLTVDYVGKRVRLEPGG